MKDCHAGRFAALDERGARHRRRSESNAVTCARRNPASTSRLKSRRNTTPNSPITRTFAPESPAHAREGERAALTGRASDVVCSYYAGDEHFSLNRKRNSPSASAQHAQPGAGRPFARPESRIRPGRVSGGKDGRFSKSAIAARARRARRATFDQARVVYFVGRGELPRRAGGGSGASERRPVKRRRPKMSFLALAAPGVNPSRVAPRSRFSSRVQGRTGSSPWPSCATARVRRMVPLCGTMKMVRRPFRSRARL